MLKVDYSKIKNLLDKLFQGKRKSHVYQSIGMQMGISQQQVFRLFEKEQLNTFEKVNTLAEVLDVSASSLILIETEELPLKQIY